MIIEAKKLSPKEQFLLRKQVIKLREQGHSNKETAEILGLSKSHTSRVYATYKREGAKGIALGKRGRPQGKCRVLTMEQEKEIRKTITDKTPDQIKFPWALWTRAAVQAFIKSQYKINIPLTTVADYLKRWGFTFQRPIKRAYQQDPIKVEKWIKEEYPAIKKRAKVENATIYWGDETGIQNTADYQKGYAPKGKTPVLNFESKKAKINMLSAITNRGSVRFMIYEDNMNYEKLIDFMKRLIRTANHKVFFILDNLRVHHAKKVKEWLNGNKDKIEVFYLPPYSPEQNPDEYLNHDLKLNIHSGLQVRTKGDLKNKTRSFMRKLQHRPAHVCAYFRHKSVLYAK